MKFLPILFLLALAFTVMGASCPPPVVVQPPDTDKCPAACENLEKLGCEQAKPLPDGTTCTQFCERTQKKGAWLDPACVATVTTCEEVDTKCAQESPIVIPGEK